MLLLQHTCDIKRYQAVGTTGQRQIQTIATGRPCLVLPMNRRTAIENQFSLGRAFDFYFDQTEDVQTSDKLVFNASSYVVRSVEPYTLPLVGHLHVLCEQEVT